jgi:hypothetical protein
LHGSEIYSKRWMTARLKCPVLTILVKEISSFIASSFKQQKYLSDFLFESPIVNAHIGRDPNTGYFVIRVQFLV